MVKSFLECMISICTEFKWILNRIYYYIANTLSDISPLYFSDEFIIKHKIYYKTSHAKKICLFAHYDENNTISDYVLLYLKELKKCGFETVFCTTSELISDLELEKIKDLCLMHIVRKNIAIDFGSWHTSLKTLNNSDLTYDSILFANDSVLGPFYPLKNIFAELSNIDADVKGLTNSYEVKKHLQSYFLYFNKKSLNSKTFKNYLNKFNYNLGRKNIIYRYELNWTSDFTNENLKVTALIDCTVFSSSTKKNNPTTAHWKELIEQHNFPFIKKCLYIVNKLPFNPSDFF